MGWTPVSNPVGGGPKLPGQIRNSLLGDRLGAAHPKYVAQGSTRLAHNQKDIGSNPVALRSLRHDDTRTRNRPDLLVDTALAAIDRGEVTPGRSSAPSSRAARRVKRRRKCRADTRRKSEATRSVHGRDACVGGAATHVMRHGVKAATDDAAGRFSEPRALLRVRAPYKTLHPWYPSLCVPCGDENFGERAPALDVAGRRAILTGGRTKISYRARHASCAAARP